MMIKNPRKKMRFLLKNLIFLNLIIFFFIFDLIIFFEYNHNKVV